MRMTEHEKVSNRVVQLSVTLAIGLLVGGVIGRFTAPAVVVPSIEPTGKREAPAKTGVREMARMVDRAEDLLDSEGGEGLGAVGDILSAASVSDLLDWGRAPEAVSRRIINEMSDAELVSTITSITKIEAEDLEEVSDLREFADRLSHIAMSGIITPDISDEFGSDTMQVEFATDASSSRGAEGAALQFDPTTRKIYAVIPNHAESGDNVMVHWYRVDQPENLLFDQYKVSPGDEYSYVWLKSPGRWNPGEYRVEFFSADENLTPIASGSYRVVGE